MEAVDIPGRLRWRCRRGMLELDMLLACFLQHHFAKLTAPQRLELDALLDLPDQDLWQLLRETHVTGSAVLAWLRTCESGNV